MFLPVSSQSIYREKDLRFEHFQLKDGLPDNSIHALLEDRTGFLWIGTKRGLVRYDGYRFDAMEIPGKVGGNTRNYITSLFEDREGFIWIGTEGAGLYCYSPRDHSFLYFGSDTTGDQALLSPEINGIDQDVSGAICVATATGFHRLVQQGEGYQVLRYAPPKLDSDLKARIVQWSDDPERLIAFIRPSHAGPHLQSFSLEDTTRVLFLTKNHKFFNGSAYPADLALLTNDRGDTIWHAYKDYGYWNKTHINIQSLRPGTYHLHYRNQLFDIIKESQINSQVKLIRLRAEEAREAQEMLKANPPESGTLEGFTDQVLTDRAGRTWITGGGGLSLWIPDEQRDPADSRFRFFSPVGEAAAPLKMVHTLALAEHRHGGIWISGKSYHPVADILAGMKDLWGKNHLQKMNSPLTGFQSVRLPQLPEGSQIRSLTEDNQETLWLGTLDNGLFKLSPPFVRHPGEEDPRASAYEHYDLMALSGSQFMSHVNVLYLDSSGSLWIGCEYQGLFKLSAAARLFTFSPLPVNDDVNTIFEDTQGLIWVGTKRNGLFQYDQQLRLQLQVKDGERGFWGNTVSDMVQDRQNRLWISTMEGFLNRHDHGKQQFVSYSKEQLLGDPFFQGQLNLTGLCLDDQDELWVGTNVGVFHLDPESQVLKVGLGNLNDPLATIFVNQLWKDAQGHLLAEDERRFLEDIPLGIWKVDPAEHPVSPRAHQPFIAAVPNIFDVAPAANSFWIGAEDGLYTLRSSHRKLSKFSYKGFATAPVWSVAEDDHRALWIVSTNEIVRVDLFDSSSYHYPVDHFDLQLPTPPLDRAQCKFLYKTRSGAMLLAGVNGFYRFNPDSVAGYSSERPIVITRLSIVNPSAQSLENIPSPYTIPYTSQVTLNYDQNAIGIEYACLQYENASGIRYRYRLEGLDDHWIDASADRVARFSHLPPGDYTFRVTATRPDGRWSVREASLDIVVLPPWWRSTWAYAGYALALIVSLWWVRRQIIQRERLKGRLELERVEKEKVKEIDQLRSRFFTNISHEFRTPLSLIKAPLEEEIAERKEPEEKKRLRGIYRNAERLQQLVEQLLDLARLEAGKLQVHPQTNDLYSFLRLLGEAFQSLADHKGIDFQRLTPEGPLSVNFDPDHLEKIIDNLLSNAFKFAPEGGWVKYEAEVIRESMSLTLKVGNNGPLIPESEIPHIFQRFYQSPSTLHQGSGIGLALIKELVDLHQGNIEVESTPVSGTWFTVRLPLEMPFREDQPIQMQAPPIAVQPSSGERQAVTPSPLTAPGLQDEQPLILLIEDHREVRTYLHRQLAAFFKVREATDGKDGWEKALEITPDLIVSDVMMPRMDGVELCRILKNDHRTDHIPVILLTAKADVESRIEGLKTGADVYLPKPFHISELLAHIHNLLEQRRRLRARFAKEIRIDLQDIEVESAEEAFLCKAISIIEQHMGNENFGVTEFCEAVNLSRTQLHRKLKALTGLSTTDFIRNLRLQRAAQLLAARYDNVSQVAYEVGFHNLSYFAKCFREKYGCSPSEFRNKAI